MDSVIAGNGAETEYFYDAVGNRDSLHNANGTATKYRYDNLNRLTNVTNHGPGGSVLSSYTYTLNNTGIRTSVTESDGSRVDYLYDDLYRLTGETRTGTSAYTINYTYDNVGNRLTQVRDGQTTSYTYNNRDQLTGEAGPNGSIAYTYDAAGRQTSKTDASGTTTYAWTDNDRMVSVSGPGVSVIYTYDAEGRRISETSAGATKNYLIDAQLPYGQVIAEVDAGGNLNASYVYGQDRISMTRGSATHYYLADGQGSVRQLTDVAGNATDSWTYTAFGEIIGRTGTTPNAFTYTGEQWDPNAGFFYLRARWYDPQNGRFTSSDPEEGDPQTPTSLHRYLYANSCPVSFVDHTGRSFSLSSATAAYIGLAIVSTAAIVEYSNLTNDISVGVGLSVGWEEFCEVMVDPILQPLAAVIVTTWNDALKKYREEAEKTREEANRRHRKKGNRYALLVRGPSPENGAILNNWNRPVMLNGRWYMDGGRKGRIKGIGLWAPSSGIGSHIEIGQFDNHPIIGDPMWGPDKWRKVYHFHFGPHDVSPHFVVGALR